ncbi:hypothetical protein J3Q64DRAFT_1293524 [Phycomyces blakesleeanus]|uniref:NAB co-repressor domain-containing protein n=1 Tax=Phycomyces blakesleeanus TaxID=4837 RepID=A0ABR3AN30_PHYBL
MMSLNFFLKTHKLDQYFDNFEKAGATDGDLDQLLQFNDGELNEFLSAVGVLPFHAIKLKKCLRELKTSPDTNNQTVKLPSDTPISIQPKNDHTSLDTPPTSVVSAISTQDIAISKDDILSRAIIFGKKGIRPITAYQDAINQATAKLALNNPTLLLHKGYLFELAKKKLIEDGYSYKRGKSRSKYSTDIKAPKMPCNPPLQLIQINHKRKEHAEQASKERAERLKDIQDILKALLSQEQHQNALLRYASHCNNQKSQMVAEHELEYLASSRQSLKREMNKLKAQERKHQWYKRRQVSRSLPVSKGGLISPNSLLESHDKIPYDEHRNEKWTGSSPSLFSSSSAASEYQVPFEDHVPNQIKFLGS